MSLHPFPAQQPPNHNRLRRVAICQESPKMLSRFYSWLQGLWAIFVLSSHLGVLPTNFHNACPPTFSWLGRQRLIERLCVCTRARAHGGFPSPRCRDTSRFALYLEDSVEPRKTGGGGTRQDQSSRNLGTEAPPTPHPTPAGFWVCSFRCSIYTEPCLHRASDRRHTKGDPITHAVYTLFYFSFKNMLGPWAQNQTAEVVA